MATVLRGLVETAASLLLPRPTTSSVAEPAASRDGDPDEDSPADGEDEVLLEFLSQWEAERGQEAEEEQAGASAQPTQGAQQLLLDIWEEEEGDDEADEGEGEEEGQAESVAEQAAAGSDGEDEWAEPAVTAVADPTPTATRTPATTPTPTSTTTAAPAAAAAAEALAPPPQRCLMCQVPLAAVAAGHVEACLASFRAPKKLCPHDSRCQLAEPAHFRAFSHAALALAIASRSRKLAKAASVASAAPTNHDRQPGLARRSRSWLPGSAESGADPLQRQPAAKRAPGLARQTTVAALFGWAVSAAPAPLLAKANGRGGRPLQAKNGSHGGHVDIAAGGSSNSGNRNRRCPFYKRIAGTSITVDAFSYGAIEGCRAYFLSHYHSDHYTGLGRSFAGHVYCSSITATLVQQYLKVPAAQVHVLPLETPVTVEGVTVTLLDANHCPGAVLFLFQLPDGRRILHTGDFRAHADIWQHPLLAGRPLHVVHLDTTYCKDLYSFPSQHVVLNYVAQLALQKKRRAGRLLVVVGSYTIGKERVFCAVADALGSKIWAERHKRQVLLALEDADLAAKLVENPLEADVHVVGMGGVRLDRLLDYVQQPALVGRYDAVLGLRPTGWSHNKNLPALTHIRPQKKGMVEVYGVPYSEHSSYTELKRWVVGVGGVVGEEVSGRWTRHNRRLRLALLSDRFIQALRPQRIIPTVNVASARNRQEMAMYFQRWLKEGEKKKEE